MANRRNNFGRRERKGFTRDRIQLPQYLTLVDAGLDGDRVKDWTSTRAAKEIERRGLALKGGKANV